MPSSICRRGPDGPPRPVAGSKGSCSDFDGRRPRGPYYPTRKSNPQKSDAGPCGGIKLAAPISIRAGLPATSNSATKFRGTRQWRRAALGIARGVTDRTLGSAVMSYAKGENTPARKRRRLLFRVVIEEREEPLPRR